VAAIVGSVQRGRDFDACWNPTTPRLAKLIADIASSAPPALDEPIDVVRVDHAYFVRDGHKRVALAKHSGREFIDAEVSRAPTTFAVEADIDEHAVFRTARELEFRLHSGAVEAIPDVRFVLTEIDGYGELYSAVRTHAFLMAEAAGRLVSWPEVARDWYESDYAPTVAKARQTIGSLLEPCTDADVFLAIHRQRLAWWGTECDDPDEAAHERLAADTLAASRGRGLIGSIMRPPQPTTPTVLPLAHGQHEPEGQADGS
jgi:hypothetical protein